VWHLLPLPAALLLGFHLAICSPSAPALASTHTLLGWVTLNLQCLAPSGYIHCSKTIKGTLKQHNLTLSQSHFCEIKLST
jgi:hypothetical protein